MVLELKAPDQASFSALLPLWPTAISYAVSYLFIAITSPVAFYALLFICIDIAYNVFEREVLVHADAAQVPTRMRRMARRRSLVVLVGFIVAVLVAFVAPRVGFGLICCALILHLRPDVSGSRA
jgi:uncharacterized membrane protein